MRELFLITLLILLVLLLSSCTLTGNQIQNTNQNIIEVIKEPTKHIEVTFCPRENCSKALEQFILGAKESVHCAFFELDLENVKQALQSQYNKGIDVKLVIDTDNLKDISNIKIPTKQDNRSAFMHNKFCIIDKKAVSTGSFNPTNNCAYKNNNNLIIINSKALSANYEDEFSELWNKQFGKGSKVKYPVIEMNTTEVRNYFCPEDRCGEKIKEELNKAKNNIYFMTFSFTHDSIANEILLKNYNNMTIKGIFENLGSNTEYSKFNIFKYQGIDVRKDTNPGKLHHKVFIIDNETVITGSFNPSSNADRSNDENILIIKDKELAKIYLEEFSYVWANYT
jgi:phosphatidylserine/phosphatidylglycerophosphate/cardiolipin synthase-like enzyme